MTYTYTLIKQIATPTGADRKTGQLWIKLDSSGNEIAVYIFIFNDWYPLIAGAF